MLVERGEAGGVLRVSDSEIIGMDDEQLRILWIAEAFGDGLGLCRGAYQGRNEK
jgi:hypothetical protein